MFYRRAYAPPARIDLGVFVTGRVALFLIVCLVADHSPAEALQAGLELADVDSLRPHLPT
jgi:hypothetical protein